MSDFKGRFVWHELTTTSAVGAKAFYEPMFGWQTKDMAMPGMTYTLATVEGVQVAGLMDLPPGGKPGWTGYMAVDECDAAARQLIGLGGKVYMEPTDIPGIGRFAIVADPFGAIFALFEAGPGDAPPELPEGTPGKPGWNELYTDDLDRVFPFYEAMFGWRREQAINMGPMGVYQIFAVGDRVLGGMMNRPPQVPSSAWLYYFNVDNINAAAKRVTANKGHIANGPMEVPGGDWILQAVDPQGIMFAMMARDQA